MKKTYVVLGGGGSFGLHTSKYLLDHADPAKVIAVGRNLPKYECFTLGMSRSVVVRCQSTCSIRAAMSGTRRIR